MILLDGSGSISPAQWQLQKEGFAAALQNQSTFPLDGTVAVGVVQWSWISSAQRTRLEVPLTVFDSAATRSSFVDTLLGLVQIGNLTNPGDGIRAGTDHLLAEGDEDAERYLCLSTDGVTNAGESLASATAYAQAEDVARLSVIALQDSAFNEATAHQHYGPHVFGGGTVNFAETVPEFRRLIEGACMNPAFEVVAIEATQGVQDWEGSVPLIADAETVVRVFTQHPEGAAGLETTAFLYGERNGQPLPLSPLPDLSRDGKAVPGDAAAERGDHAFSLNWDLPESWTQGDVRLEVRLPGGQACVEAIAPAETCTADVSFADADVLEVKFMKVRTRGAFDPDDGWEVLAPSDEEITEQMRRVQDAVPGVKDLNRGTMWTLAPQPNTDLMRSRQLGRLHEQRVMEGCITLLGCRRIYYGVLEGSFGGRADFGGSASWGSLADSADPGYTGRARNRAAHELFHNFGVRHTAHDDNGPEPNDPERKLGWCGETAPMNAPDFPYREHIAAVSEERPTLGPLGDPDTEVWGLARSPFLSAESGLGIVDPSETFALMSYCHPLPGADSQGRWASKPSWEHAVEWLGATSSLAGVTVNTGPHLLVSGVLDLATDDLELDSLMPLPTSGMPAPEPGPYTLELVDDVGAIIDAVPFEVIEIEADEGDHPAHALVHVAVPDPGAQLDEIRVRRGGDMLGDRQRGASRPDVTITAPGPGHQAAGQLTVAWDVDPDGAAEITSTVLVGNDGDGWDAVALRTEETELVVDTTDLPPSEQARVRLLVSDGFSTAVATSEEFTIEPSAPTVTVTTPADGQVFVATQLVSFQAIAHAAGQMLDGSAIEWESDLDGPIGGGAWLSMRADALSEGVHTISAVATGPGGLTATDQVTIEVWRIAPPSILAPADFTADCFGTKHWWLNYVDAEWSAVSGAAHYNLYYQEVDAGGDPVGEPVLRWTGTSTSHRDEDLPHPGIFDYWATAVGAGDLESEASNIVRVDMSGFGTCVVSG